MPLMQNNAAHWEMFSVLLSSEGIQNSSHGGMVAVLDLDPVLLPTAAVWPVTMLGHQTL